MQLFKRIIIQLKTQMNQVVDDFENHQALAAIAIEEIENIGRNSRIQLNRVRNRITEIEKRIGDLKLDVEKWAERAVKLESHSPEDALTCVKRIKQVEKEIEILSRQHEDSLKQEKKIASDLSQICEQLAQMKSKRENLIARENLAQASGRTLGACRNSAGDANAIFERWENRVIGEEFELPPEDFSDSFAEGLEQAEYEAELKARLQSLVEKARKS